MKINGSAKRRWVGGKIVEMWRPAAAKRVTEFILGSRRMTRRA